MWIFFKKGLVYIYICKPVACTQRCACRCMNTHKEYVVRGLGTCVKKIRGCVDVCMVYRVHFCACESVSILRLNGCV